MKLVLKLLETGWCGCSGCDFIAHPFTSTYPTDILQVDETCTKGSNSRL